MTPAETSRAKEKLRNIGEHLGDCPRELVDLCTVLAGRIGDGTALVPVGFNLSWEKLIGDLSDPGRAFESGVPIRLAALSPQMVVLLSKAMEDVAGAAFGPEFAAEVATHEAKVRALRERI